MTELDDHELLAEFARSESEEAFATLVTRHVSLVYSAARRFSGNPHHAQEITQVVFIILARKAGSLRRCKLLAGWLYQTARLTAASFVRGEIRRERREQEAYMQSTLNEPNAAAWELIAPLLDEAMGRLSETDRNALVLRFFENRSAHQVGAALKLSEPAAHKRVTRALEKLRKLFTKRGVTLTATLIANAVAVNSVQAAPVGLAVTVAAAAAKGTAVAASITALVEGTTKTMTWLKLKCAAGVGVAALLVGSVVTVALAITGDNVRAADGFEVMGYLTYTSFNAPGKPRSKAVMMFDVKVAGESWLIRTEPVLHGKGGMGFYEASSTTKDCVVSLTALDSAYKSSESPFQKLRAQLMESNKDDVYFTNPPFVIPAAISNVFRTTVPNPSNSVGNVAVARVVSGKNPPVDSSYAAFLWFAFSPPRVQIDGTNKLLLQIWDDGNPLKARLRRATWNQYAESPHLVSSAVYAWEGKYLLPSGKLDDIDVSDVSKPLEMAVRYEVEEATNFSAFRLPLNFRMTRFNTKRLEKEEPGVSSSVVASVVKVGPFSSAKFLEVRAPGKTYVSDYRFSDGELNPRPRNYLIEPKSGSLLGQIQKSAPYAGSSEQR
jgi:RNA polymerase sigma factor (sigma-70 family)